MALVYNGEFRLYKVPNMGPFANNGYVISDAQGKMCYIVDAPSEPEKLIGEASGMSVKGILITHNHQDHLMGLDEIRKATGAPVGVHDADKSKLPAPPDFLLGSGDKLPLGDVHVQVIHTPGHTPGAICLLVGKHLIAGDTLFPGGPGSTQRPQDLRQIIDSITQKLLVLSDDVTVYPGHGGNTTIEQTREEYIVFSRRDHPADLCGSVVWLNS